MGLRPTKPSEAFVVSLSEWPLVSIFHTPPVFPRMSLQSNRRPATPAHTQKHSLRTLFLFFFWCSNNCNCVFKQQVAQSTKNSPASCRADLLSLRRGGKRRMATESRRRCRERGGEMTGKRWQRETNSPGFRPPCCD